MVKQLNRWYDGLKEPWRFLLAMALTMSGICALSYGGVQVRLAAAVYLAVLVLVRMKGAWDAAA
jgi:hypothetical protein